MKKRNVLVKKNLPGLKFKSFVAELKKKQGKNLGIFPIR